MQLLPDIRRFSQDVQGQVIGLGAIPEVAKLGFCRWVIAHVNDTLTTNSKELVGVFIPNLQLFHRWCRTKAGQIHRSSVLSNREN